MIVVLLAALVAAPGAGRSRPPPEQPAQEQPLSDVELRERVETYLGAIDRPVSAARWKALGPRAAPLLEAIIADPSQFPTRRAKAVDGLVAAAPDRAASVVGKLARDEKEAGVVRMAAMRGTGKVFSSSRAIRELRPVLRSARTPGLRATAADVIAGEKGGCAEVRAQIAREKAEHRPAFERAAKKCPE